DTDKPSKKQRKPILGTFKSRSRQFVACNCNKCKGRKVDPRTRESHMRERELPIRSESSNMATEGGISQINAPYDPIELDEININDVDSDTDFNNKQVFSFLVKNPRNPKQKQASSHVSFPLVVTEQLLYNKYDGGIEGAELPIPDINAGFTWIVYWIFKYQERYRLPDTAIDSLLKFVRYILVLVDENTYSKFPKTLYMARKLFGIGNQLIKFATRKKCCKLYAVKDLPTDQPYHCTFQDYPNHPIKCLPYITHKEKVGSLAHDDFDLLEYFEFLSMSKNVKEKAGIGSEPFPGALLKPKKEANLPQDILKLLIEYYNSAYDNYFFISLSDIHNTLPEAIGDLEILKVHRAKVAHALCWLKENNRYYKDMIIIIDNEFLQSLSVDGSIDDQNTQIVAEDLDHDEEDM
ncbi:10712_t:CDS:2, partial [Rhizophagus irregularis]